MPTEFQRVMEIILANETNVFIFIDDILTATKGSKEEHIQKIENMNAKIELGWPSIIYRNLKER